MGKIVAGPLCRPTKNGRPCRGVWHVVSRMQQRPYTFTSKGFVHVTPAVGTATIWFRS